MLENTEQLTLGYQHRTRIQCSSKNSLSNDILTLLNNITLILEDCLMQIRNLLFKIKILLKSCKLSLLTAGILASSTGSNL